MPAAFDFRSLIRTVPDFPRAGVRFRDITTLLKDGAVFHAVVDEIAAAYRASSVGKVAAIEARGFLVGAAVAHALGAGLVPVRKQGKLPAECLGRDYTLEYGVDRLELHRDAVQPRERVLLVDDLVATGGTASAALHLIRRAGGSIVGCAFIVDLPALGGRALIEGQGYPVVSLCEFADDD